MSARRSWGIARGAIARSTVARSTLALWTGFVLVHAWVIGAAFLGPGIPLGDVTSIYPTWARPALTGSYVVGVDAPWVYPILALVPVVAAGLGGIPAYGAGWLVMIIVLDAVAFGMLTGWFRRRARRHRAAWWWLVFLLLLGPIALTRVDAVTVPIAIIAMLFVRSRPVLAAVLLSLATWIKVWPAALIAALLVTARARLRVVVAVVVTSVLVVLFALLAGSGANVLSFIGDQTGRDLQIEAPVSTIWLWLTAAGVPGVGLLMDHALNTFEVYGPGTDVVAALMTPLLAIVLLAIALIGIRSVRRGAHFAEAFPAAALAFVVAMIALNKVGSPQFICWVAPPVIVGIMYRGGRWKVPAILAMTLAALTQVVYPFFYGWVLVADPVLVAILTLRGLTEFVLLGWAIRALWRSGSARSTALTWKSEQRPLERAAE